MSSRPRPASVNVCKQRAQHDAEAQQLTACTKPLQQHSRRLATSSGPDWLTAVLPEECLALVVSHLDAASCAVLFQTCHALRRWALSQAGHVQLVQSGPPARSLHLAHLLDLPQDGRCVIRSLGLSLSQATCLAQVLPLISPLQQGRVGSLELQGAIIRSQEDGAALAAACKGLSSLCLREVRVQHPSFFPALAASCKQLRQLRLEHIRLGARGSVSGRELSQQQFHGMGMAGTPRKQARVQQVFASPSLSHGNSSGELMRSPPGSGSTSHAAEEPEQAAGAAAAAVEASVAALGVLGCLPALQELEVAGLPRAAQVLLQACPGQPPVMARVTSLDTTLIPWGDLSDDLCDAEGQQAAGGLHEEDEEGEEDGLSMWLAQRMVDQELQGAMQVQPSAFAQLRALTILRRHSSSAPLFASEAPLKLAALRALPGLQCLVTREIEVPIALGGPAPAVGAVAGAGAGPGLLPHSLQQVVLLGQATDGGWEAAVLKQAALLRGLQELVVPAALDLSRLGSSRRLVQLAGLLGSVGRVSMLPAGASGEGGCDDEEEEEEEAQQQDERQSSRMQDPSRHAPASAGQAEKQQEQQVQHVEADGGSDRYFRLCTSLGSVTPSLVGPLRLMAKHLVAADLSACLGSQQLTPELIIALDRALGSQTEALRLGAFEGLPKGVGWEEVLRALPKLGHLSMAWAEAAAGVLADSLERLASAVRAAGRELVLQLRGCMDGAKPSASAEQAMDLRQQLGAWSGGLLQLQLC